MISEIKIKRIYDKAEKIDGFRVFIDRLWPRGLKKDEVHFHLWIKDIAPSSKLRKWFRHDEKKWSEFQKYYLEELKTKKELAQSILDQATDQAITLLFGAKDLQHNHAIVLKKFLEKNF